MAINIAINGLGRIGRLVFRALYEQRRLGSLVNVVAVGDIVGADVLAYLLTFDSVQGRFTGEATYSITDDELQRTRTAGRKPKPDLLTVDGQTMRVVSAREPAGLPWRELGVDVVIESTGRFTDAALARGHLTAGARKVIITAPGKGEVKTIVMGVNHPEFDPEQHHIVSNASCTTNCLAPLVHVLLTEGVGIEEGLMTTVHSYTASQKTVDGPDESDWRGGRSAAINIIPSSTGAAKAVALVCPAVKGKLTGMAFRVPTPTVSVVDLTVRTTTETSLEQITAAMRRASQTYLKGILDVTCDEVVSSDFIHSPASSTFDVGASIELNNRFFKLVSWYDNEWGYSNRVADLLKVMVEKWQ